MQNMLTRDQRAKRNAKIASLYRDDGWTANRIAARGDLGGLTEAGVRKVLARAGVAPRAPGPRPRRPGDGGHDTEVATPAPATGTRCPRCRTVARDMYQEQCGCGWMFWIHHRDPGPRFSTRTKFYELDPYGQPFQTSGPRDD